MVAESYLYYEKNIKWSKLLQAEFPTPLSTFKCYALIIACFPFYSFPF